MIYEDTIAAIAIDKIFEKFEKCYLQNNYKRHWRILKIYMRSDSCIIVSFESNFEKRNSNLKECGVELPKLNFIHVFQAHISHYVWHTKKMRNKPFLKVRIFSFTSK